MRRPSEEDVADAVDRLHNDSWRSVNKPQLSTEQVEHLLLLWVPVFASKPRLPSVPKEYRKAPQKRKPAGTVTSSKVPARIRQAALRRDEWTCQRCGISLYGRDYSLQHRDNRGMGGSKTKHTLANLVALCGSATTGCHGHVESQPIESDRWGWSVPNGVTPEEWPVFRFGTSWMQPGEEWVAAVPHPRQIKMMKEAS